MYVSLLRPRSAQCPGAHLVSCPRSEEAQMQTASKPTWAAKHHKVREKWWEKWSKTCEEMVTFTMENGGSPWFHRGKNGESTIMLVDMLKLKDEK